MRLYRSGQLIRPDLQAHIYTDALYDNMHALRSLCKPDTRFCAVVKANAYGHGIAEVVNLLKTDADFFAVASIFEAIHISYIVPDRPILILEPVNPHQPSEQILKCTEHGFHCTVSSIEAVRFVGNVLSGTDEILHLHVNVETGMGRCGMDADASARVISMIDDCPNTNLAGVFTHFATADEEDLSYTRRQLEHFNDFLDANHLRNRPDTIIHAANSAATIKLPESHFDMVRCGISLYGYYSRPMKNPPIALRPVMKLQAPIVNLKKIPKGHAVSYGCSHITQRDTIAALIPLGYADGYWRCFSNCAKMRIDDKYAPVIGRVCMDQVLIDVTDLPDVQIGQTVTIIDNSHDSPCGVYALCDLAGTICYEILTCVHAHVNRIVH